MTKEVEITRAIAKVREAQQFHVDIRKSYDATEAKLSELSEAWDANNLLRRTAEARLLDLVKDGI